MKLIFLDCDGVINAGDSDPIDDELMDNLQMIIVATDARIILSSTWRLYENFRREITRACEERGMEIVGATPEIEGGERHEEITKWIEDEDPRDLTYAVIDDDIGAKGEHPFFETSMSHGLTPEIADKVIEHLNG